MVSTRDMLIRLIEALRRRVRMIPDSVTDGTTAPAVGMAKLRAPAEISSAEQLASYYAEQIRAGGSTEAQLAGLKEDIERLLLAEKEMDSALTVLAETVLGRDEPANETGGARAHRGLEKYEPKMVALEYEGDGEWTGSYDGGAKSADPDTSGGKSAITHLGPREVDGDATTVTVANSVYNLSLAGSTLSLQLNTKDLYFDGDDDGDIRGHYYKDDNESYTSAATVDLSRLAGADEKASVSANDTTPGYLNGKLVAGTDITLTEGNDGGNETLTIACTAGSGSDDVAGSAIIKPHGAGSAIVQDGDNRFQSAPPARGAMLRCGVRGDLRRVSIRAPRTGGDRV